MAMTKIKGLQMWCKKMAEGYPLVDIANFTTAWRDGLAFCAIIHRFRPDLIDFHTLSPENVFENCKMAFEIAERELSIPAFLEAEDMVRLKVPDKLSIITYVSQYYNYLHALPQLGGPGVKSKVSTKTTSGTKRPTDSDASQAPITKKATTESKENLAPATERSAASGDKCAICQNHVFLVERHMESGKLYHRSCFRHSELSPANKVLTRSPFLSPSLSFDTQSSTSLSKDTGLEKNSKMINGNRQLGAEPVKVFSDTSAISKKVENVGLKHPFNELSREDTKKLKMQPKMLVFDDEKSKKTSATKDSITAENLYNQSSDAGKSLPYSNKKALNLEKRSEDILISEKTVQLSKSAHVKHQQKDLPTLDTPKSKSVTTPAAAALTIKMNIPETQSTAVISKTSNTPLPSQPSSETVQSKYNLPSAKDTQKPSNENKLDTVLSKNNALPSVQNLQKLFSGKSDLDISEPLKPSHPVARPRSGILRSVSEEPNDHVTPNKPALTASDEKHKDVTPKAVPRRSTLEKSVTTVAPKQQEIPSQSEQSLIIDSYGIKIGTPRLPTPDFPPPHPKSAPPPLPTSLPSGKFTSEAGDICFKKPSADRLLQETKTSIHPAKHTEDPKNTVLNTIKPTAECNFKINQAGNVSNANDGKVLSGLLSSLAGIRGQISSSPGPTNNSLQSPAKIPAPSLDDKVKTGNILISSSNTPVNKTCTTTSTPAKLQQHSISQTDTFSGIQTPSKVQEPVGTFRSTQPATGTPGITLSNHNTKTEVKLRILEKINNDSKSAIPYNKETNNKEAAISKVQSLKINENCDIKSAGKNILNSKDSEKKSEYKDSRSDPKQSSSTAESKSLFYSKNRALSSSKEDVLDMNNIKLRIVMPEQKEVQEPRAAVYDVKLKKVDVIKGDTKWDNVPQKPLRSVNTSERNMPNKDTAFDQSGLRDQTEGPLSHEGLVQNLSGSITKESHSSKGNSQKTGISNELPQWREDIEERKKLISQSESEMNQSKYMKGIDNKKTAINYEKKLEQDSKMKVFEIKNSSDGVLSLHKGPGDIKALEKDSMTNVGSKTNVRKLSPKRENRGNGNKLDWQLEAEKRMAALAGFDLEVAEKLKEPEKPNKVSFDTASNPQNKMSTMYHKSEGDIPTINDKTSSSDRKYNGDRLMSGDSNVQNSSTVFEKRTSKSKESGLEFVLNKTKLKPIEVDISILPEETESLNNDHSQSTLDKGGKGEDFRDILHHLKRVPAIESGKIDIVKRNNGIDSQHGTKTGDILPSSVTKPSQNNNVNNNNKLITSEQDHLFGVENIHKLNKNEHTPLKTTGFGRSIDANENEKKNQISEPSKEKLALGKLSGTNEKEDKVKIKISALGNKVTVKSPPSTPTQKKKIPVTKKFDFEHSSDFEHSLTESTAKLTIQDKHTTPAPHSNHEVVSPNHISAIELQNQMQNIDARLTELELRGRKIEESIRKVSSLEDDDDQLMIEWFSLINERNDLVRKEADLIYISREQELETEQEKIEYQLRYLMNKPDECKSPEEKQEENYLIQHKITLVEQRNKIVDSMDEDRIRYENEDRGIEVTLKKKGLWKDSTGTLTALKGRKVAKSMFYT